MQTSRLELHAQTVLGGSGGTERSYLDFVIDGVSLRRQLKPLDRVTGLGWWGAEAERRYIDQLLIRVPGESPTGRVPIYICAECGELGCGAITGVVERTSGSFVWRDFVFESGGDLAVVDASSYQGVGPFLFNKHEYWQLLSGRLGAL